MRKVLHIIVTALFLASTVPTFAQLPGLSQAFVLSATTGVQSSMPVGGYQAGLYELSFVASGTVSTCTVQIEDAAAASFTLRGVAQTCTSTGSYAVTVTPTNFVHLNVTALTGSGNVTFTLTAVPNTPVAPSLALGVFTCGTIAANGACTNTSAGVAHIVTGIATLASNTSTITGLSPAFTSSSSYFCEGNDITTRANPVQVIPASGTTVTITDTTGATDNVSFVCVGN